MHKFIVPTKDSWIYELSSSQNYGGDEVLELRKDFKSDVTASIVRAVSRILVQFDVTPFSESVVKGDLGSRFNEVSYSLHLYSTEASELPATYSLQAFPLSESWEEGTGKFSSDPTTQDGVTWDRKDQRLNVSTWSMEGGYVSTGSRVSGSGSEANGSGSARGGAWYTGSLFEQTQSFSYQKPDIEMDVTNIVKKWISGSNETYPSDYILNNGLIIKKSGSKHDFDGEENDSTRTALKFFSRNTHTIYAPRLEMKWNDSKVAGDTGSLTQLTMSGEVDNHVYVKNIKERYYEPETVKFRVGSRKRYVQKDFSTSVQTFSGSYIPTGSGFYSIVDLHTGETLVPFGIHSSMSVDKDSNYFLQDLNSFHPNRVYKILLKVNYEDSQSVIYDDDNYEFIIAR